MSDLEGNFQNKIESLPRLNQYSFENILKMYFDDDEQTYYYNLANTIFFPEDLSQDVYITYRVPGRGMSWTNLSFIHYGTIRLWWLLCALNNVDNPMIFPEPGTDIKILKPQSLRDVMQQIQQAK